MANELGVYSPIFYAQEALLNLEKALGMASRVHRGFEAERNTRNWGETISIRRPSTFTAQNAPSAAQDLATDTVNVTLDQWKEVKFSLTDKELAISEDRIVDDHIRPAAYALADEIDMQGTSLYTDVPWFRDQAGGSAAIADLVGTRQVLFDNAVPLGDPGMVHFMLSGQAEADLLALNTFHNADSDASGGDVQRRGTLGTRFGMELFANQNTQDHVSGGMTDKSGLTNGATAVNATTIAIDAIDATGTINKGDILEVAGVTQKFAVTANVTAVGGAATVAVTPKVPVAISDNTAVTVIQQDDTQNLAFHRNAFALAMAPLPDQANRLPGVLVQSVQDPVTGLALRARIYYDGDNSKMNVALDCLFGWKTLDPNMAARFRA
jgi:hypothetical protein